MTTHVFIVDDNTFKYHLEYLFAGTGAKDNNLKFLFNPFTKIHYAKEELLVGMLADGNRVRKGDLIIFYLMASSKNKHEGKFYGIFKAKQDGIFIDDVCDNNHVQFLSKELAKSLTFRLEIEPYEVYAEGVTEWEALDEIKSIKSPNQMLWSLIYRKLKGNRGNTPITIYESERLISLIRQKNKFISLKCTTNESYTFNRINCNIETVNGINKYIGSKQIVDLLPRINSSSFKEFYLQAYLTQNLGKSSCNTLNNILNIYGNSIEWMGNEVKCGVGMQSIDIMLSNIIDENKRMILPIELKAVSASIDNVRQITRYIDWIEQYYKPNRESIIQPVLICNKNLNLEENVIDSFKKFNSINCNRCLPLIFIDYTINIKGFDFEKVDY